MRPGSVVVVLGTRPEIIKLAPVVRALGGAAEVVHTGQHFDHAMSQAFLTDCGIPEPVANLGIGGRSRVGQVAAAAARLDEMFAAALPGAVVVQGDTNSTLAGALAANGHGVPIVHVEAGLRSRDRHMPEEHNRVMVDHLADMLCAATAENMANLRAEGISEERITLTGNTIVEAVTAHLPTPSQQRSLVRGYELPADGYVLATVHRPENTDNREALVAVLTELAELAKDGWPVVLPLHPRTARAVATAGCEHLLLTLRVIEPIGYSEFLGLAAGSALLVSDSGGLQEEATVLKRPLVVVRCSTERPESLRAFAHLVEPGPEVGEAARRWLYDPAARRRLAGLSSPYGDGHAATRIAQIAINIAKDAIFANVTNHHPHDAIKGECK